MNAFKPIWLMWPGMAMIILSGCVAPAVYMPPSRPATKAPAVSAPQKAAPTTKATPSQAVTPKQRREPKAKPSSRQLASLQLVDQGRSLLKKNQPDRAIHVFQQAISLDPGNGEHYYYLAQAWLLKKNFKQARECNRLAGIYLKGEVKWQTRLRKQRERIP